MAKFIFVTGGVVSSLGKGLAAAALGAVLQARGYRVRLRKLDPYLNVDPGTMSPYQHGEVYVTDDGAETDLDLGHYERFTGIATRKSDNVTTGRVYSDILARERRGDYLGATVQVVPHVTDEIKDFIRADLDKEDFVICEIGGTVGDIESLPFLEAIRQFGHDVGRSNSLFLHVTLVPYIKAAGELKTKPTQHSVKELQSHGIQPDVLLCRCEHELPADERGKIGRFCNIPTENVIPALDASSIHEVPLAYHREGLDRAVLNYFGLNAEQVPDLSRWSNIIDAEQNPTQTVRVGIVGKYVSLLDAYKSLNEAVRHAGIAKRVRVDIDWVDAEEVQEMGARKRLAGMHAILVPGAFGQRGADGKMEAIRYARENKIPYLGICFGMQMACIEVARNLGGMEEASSSEFGPTNQPLVGLMTEWETEEESGDRRKEKRSEGSDLGGTMRLGAYEAWLRPNSQVATIYGGNRISERHRHRYEVNSSYIETLEKVGLQFTGMSPDGKLPEIVELEQALHPWFVGVQFHPELKSRPFEPHPLFVSFVSAAIDYNPSN